MVDDVKEWVSFEDLEKHVEMSGQGCGGREEDFDL